jgi:hypothetical protein
MLLVALAAPAASAATDEGRSKVIPWSGHWWPMRRGQMANGYTNDTSPMRKHDQLTRARAASWERANHSDPDMPQWYGHCHAWSAAAISEPEPTVVVRYRNVRFRVGDLKALLTEGHFADKPVLFGTRYTGPGTDQQDIYPDQLWKLCQDYIGKQGLALLMDLDGGKEVWTYPVYAYRVEYQPMNNQPDWYYCTMMIFSANTNVPPDYVGTVQHRKLYQFQVKMKDGVIQEGTGRWLGSSRYQHPDFAWYPSERGQENPELVHSLAQRIVEETLDARSSERLQERLLALRDMRRERGTDELGSGPWRPEPADRPAPVWPSLPAVTGMDQLRSAANRRERREAFLRPDAATARRAATAAPNRWRAASPGARGPN